MFLKSITVNPTINPPFGDNLYNLSTGILGMVNPLALQTNNCAIVKAMVLNNSLDYVHMLHNVMYHQVEIDFNPINCQQ